MARLKRELGPPLSVEQDVVGYNEVTISNPYIGDTIIYRYNLGSSSALKQISQNYLSARGSAAITHDQDVAAKKLIASLIAQKRSQLSAFQSIAVQQLAGQNSTSSQGEKRLTNALKNCEIQSKIQTINLCQSEQQPTTNNNFINYFKQLLSNLLNKDLNQCTIQQLVDCGLNRQQIIRMDPKLQQSMSIQTNNAQHTTQNHRYFQDTQSEVDQIYVQRCFRCNKPGHIARNCPQQNEVSCNCCLGNHEQSECKNQTCHRCGQIGHLQQACTAGSSTCYKCHKHGHNEKNCGMFIWLNFASVDHKTLKDRYKTQDLKDLICLNCGQSGHFNCLKYPVDGKDGVYEGYPKVNLSLGASSVNRSFSKQHNNQNMYSRYNERRDYISETKAGYSLKRNFLNNSNNREKISDFSYSNRSQYHKNAFKSKKNTELLSQQSESSSDSSSSSSYSSSKSKVNKSRNRGKKESIYAEDDNDQMRKSNFQIKKPHKSTKRYEVSSDQDKNDEQFTKARNKNEKNCNRANQYHSKYYSQKVHNKSNNKSRSDYHQSQYKARYPLIQDPRAKNKSKQVIQID